MTETLGAGAPTSDGPIKELGAVLRDSGGERGIVLVTALLVMLLLMPLGAIFLGLALTESMIASNQVTTAQGFNITEAGIEHARGELIGANINAILASNPPLINFTNGGQTVSFAGGTYSVTVANNIVGVGSIPADPGGANNDTDNIVVLTANGTLGNAASSIQVVVQRAPAIPPGARAAVTTNGPAATNGNLLIDGRDHDVNGKYLTGDPGTYGIFTAGSYFQGGSSDVGGTDTGGFDHVPAQPADPAVIEDNYTGSMAATPDEAMGYSTEGALESLAQSGVNGSQYVTDPASLTYPLSGVTYVELPCGGTWVPANIDGEGILVVHSDCYDAVIKNLNIGTFKGLLMADDIVHIHTTIIGAVVSLTTAPSSGNVIGNGSGQVLYSRQALANAMASVSGSYRILAWRQL
ncbi:MAG: hypothetical protein ACE5EW_08355 [Thermoplasmata archaeon]